MKKLCKKRKFVFLTNDGVLSFVFFVYTYTKKSIMRMSLVWVWVVLYTFILSYTLLYNLKHFYTIMNTPTRSQAQYLYLFLTH